jgi:hypothetical protein
MMTSPPSQIAEAFLHLSDWASIASILVAALTLVGLLFVAMQLIEGNRAQQQQVRAQRAQATMLFQERFKESQPVRQQLFSEFPIHASLLRTAEGLDIEVPDDGAIEVWESVERLSADQKRAARGVVNALNDVAQYVVDGLELHSALQQYHLVIIRVGALLNPYLEQENAVVAGRPQLRYGRRVPILYNAALAYHRCNPKHSGRPVGLKRPHATEPDRDVEVYFFDGERKGLEQFACFADTPHESLLLPDEALTRVISAAEAKLRR